MIFIHPMWDSENERLGMKACTRRGYRLREIGDFLGFLGLIGLLGVIAYLVFLKDGTSGRGWWALVVPVTLGGIGRVLYTWGWSLAVKKGFHYDDSRVVTWMEGGQRMQYPPPGTTSNPDSND